jgi:hypothetical protein
MPKIERPHEVRNMNSTKARKMVTYKGKQEGKRKVEKEA